jgi:hypothetical protein
MEISPEKSEVEAGICKPQSAMINKNIGYAWYSGSMLPDAPSDHLPYYTR